MTKQTELLREAVECLRPFAELAQDHQKLRGDNDPLFGINKATILHGDARKAKAFLAKIDAAEVDESEFQVISGNEEDACIEAATSGPRDVALREAMHYAAQYASDDCVRVIEQREIARLGFKSGNYGPTATPPADAAMVDDALCESLIEASDMRWNGDVYVGDGADLMNLVRAALRARAVPDEAALSLLRKVDAFWSAGNFCRDNPDCPWEEIRALLAASKAGEGK